MPVDRQRSKPHVSVDGVAMLKVEDLVVRGLAPASFSIKPHQCLVITGPSGSGKTLLLRAIADLDSAKGKIFLKGKERSAMSGPQWRKQIRFFAAEPGWWSEIVQAHFGQETSSRAQELAKMLGLENEVLERPIHALSTGERQRLALIRGLLDDPDVLLLDEPTGALDSKAESAVESCLTRELLRGCAALIVTHDVNQVARLATHHMVIDHGRLRKVRK